MTRPFWIVTTALNVVGVAAYQWWFQVSPLLTASYATLIFAVSGLSGFLYSRSASVLIAQTQERIQRKKLEVAALLGALRNQGLEQAADQGRRFLEAMDSFSRVSKKRFGNAAITLSSYLSASQHLEEAILHNLREVQIAQASIGTIERGNDGSSVVRVKEKELRDIQEAKIQSLLNENDEAILLLYETGVALSNIDELTRETREASYARLAELAKRAERYGAKGV